MDLEMEGKFIRQIGRKGKWPNEYINLRSFCFDKNNEDLLFYTGDFGNIFKFNSNGEFIEKLFRLPYADQFYSLNNILVFSGFGIQNIRKMPDDITQFATTNRLGQKIDWVPLLIYSLNKWRAKKVYNPGNFPSTKFSDVLLL